MKKKVTIYLDQEVWRAFRAKCIGQGDSASEVIEYFIRDYIGKPLPEKPIGGNEEDVAPPG